MLDLIPLTFVNATPLLLAGLGGLLSELSGVINFALEGMMLSGAFAAVLGTWLTGSPWTGLFCGICAGAFAGAIHAIVCLKFRSNQIISSIAINLLASGITGLLLNQVFKIYGASPEVTRLPDLNQASGEILPGWELPAWLDAISVVTLFALFITVAVIVLVRWTVWGLRIRACGENPAAALAAGLQVTKIRFISVLFGGALAGLAGAYLSVGELSQFIENMTQGRGYLAIAALILSRWTPFGLLISTLLFGFTQAFSEWLAVRSPGIPQEGFLALPYLVCFIVLALHLGKRTQPTALGHAV